MHIGHVYRYRRSEQEVEEGRLRRALTGSLNTGLMPSSSLCAKGGRARRISQGIFALSWMGGKVAQAPYTFTRRRAPGPTAAPTRIMVPSPITSAHACLAHKLPACVTCKRLCLSAATCRAKGHHAPGYVDQRPLSEVCQTHGLPPCLCCALVQRGVWHCCQQGHHKVNTPHKCLGKRTAPAPAGTSKRPRLQSAAPAHSRMHAHPHSRYIPPTPLAPKRRRPKSPIPPFPAAPRPQGMRLDDDDTAVVRALLFKGHGRASSEVT